jgi:hypothetical protein
MSLPANWLNDGVKGFVSNTPDHVPDDLPQFPHLRVIRPSARYLLAMKCIAARVEGYDHPGDKKDARFWRGTSICARRRRCWISWPTTTPPACSR